VTAPSPCSRSGSDPDTWLARARGRFRFSPSNLTPIAVLNAMLTRSTAQVRAAQITANVPRTHFSRVSAGTQRVLAGNLRVSERPLHGSHAHMRDVAHYHSHGGRGRTTIHCATRCISRHRGLSSANQGAVATVHHRGRIQGHDSGHVLVCAQTRVCEHLSATTNNSATNYVRFPEFVALQPVVAAHGISASGSVASVRLKERGDRHAPLERRNGSGGRRPRETRNWGNPASIMSARAIPSVTPLGPRFDSKITRRPPARHHAAALVLLTPVPAQPGCRSPDLARTGLPGRTDAVRSWQKGQ